MAANVGTSGDRKQLVYDGNYSYPPIRATEFDQLSSMKHFEACPGESKQFLECVYRNSGQISNCDDTIGILMSCVRNHENLQNQQ